MPKCTKCETELVLNKQNQDSYRCPKCGEYQSLDDIRANENKNKNDVTKKSDKVATKTQQKNDAADNSVSCADNDEEKENKQEPVKPQAQHEDSKVKQHSDAKSNQQSEQEQPQLQSVHTEQAQEKKTKKRIPMLHINKKAKSEDASKQKEETKPPQKRDKDWESLPAGIRAIADDPEEDIEELKEDTENESGNEEEINVSNIFVHILSSNPLLIASCVLGLASIIFSVFIFVVGLICGVASLGIAIYYRVKKKNVKKFDKLMATAGIVLGVIGLVLSVVFGILTFNEDMVEQQIDHVYDGDLSVIVEEAELNRDVPEYLLNGENIGEGQEEGIEGLPTPLPSNSWRTLEFSYNGVALRLWQSKFQDLLSAGSFSISNNGNSVSGPGNSMIQPKATGHYYLISPDYDSDVLFEVDVKNTSDSEKLASKCRIIGIHITAYGDEEESIPFEFYGLSIGMPFDLVPYVLGVGDDSIETEFGGPKLQYQYSSDGYSKQVTIGAKEYGGTIYSVSMALRPYVDFTDTESNSE